MKERNARKTRYGQTTLLEKVATIAWLTLLRTWSTAKPVASPNLTSALRILYRLCVREKDEQRSNLRIANETIGRTCTDTLPYNQIQFVQPGALSVWRSYVPAKERTIDELCTGAKLLWLGPKQLDKETDVFLVVHGPLPLFAQLTLTTHTRRRIHVSIIRPLCWILVSRTE